MSKANVVKVSGVVMTDTVKIVGAPVAVKVSTLKASTNWTRTEGEDLRVADLAARMAAEGQREPIWIRKGTTEVVAGNRRVAAAKVNKWETILAVEVDAKADTDLRANVAENVGASRAEITTAGLINAIKEYERRGYDTGQIAKELGRDASTVKSALKVASAHPAVRAALEAGEIAKRIGTFDDTFAWATGATGKDGEPVVMTLPMITFAHARRIVEIKSEGEQLKALQKWGHLSSSAMYAKIVDARKAAKAAKVDKGGEGGEGEGDEGEDGIEAGAGDAPGKGNGGAAGKDLETLRLRAAQTIVPTLEALNKRIATLPETYRAMLMAAAAEVAKAVGEVTGEVAFKAARSAK